MTRIPRTVRKRPSEEITPVPMLRSLLCFEKASTEAKGEEVDAMELHRERITLTKEHVVSLSMT